MKYLFLSILMIGVGIGVVGCEDDDSSDADLNLITFNGNVFNVPLGVPANNSINSSKATANDYYISGDNGTNYLAGESLPEEFRVSQLRVWVSAEMASITKEVRTPPTQINIIEIERR